MLSLDGPPDGRAPDPSALGALLDVQQVLVAMGPALHARILDDHLQERERSGREAQRLELLGRVACEVAHDLNNLLLVITASADLALLEGHGSDDLLQDVISAADSARQLSWRLLTLGAPHADTERPLDVCASVDENADLLRRIFPADGPELHVRHDPGAQWVYAAPSAMTQILLNLVVNARDAEPISKVEVWVDEVQEYGVDFVVIGVSDDGHGMTSDVLRRVFERAFTTKATGSGIGLSAVKRIVDRLEGRILVESEPGVGTTFRVQLPRAKVSV